MSFHEFEKPMNELLRTGSEIKYNVGDETFTTIVHKSNRGYMGVGTKVKVVSVLGSYRSYDIQDEEGTIIFNVGAVI